MMFRFHIILVFFLCTSVNATFGQSQDTDRKNPFGYGLEMKYNEAFYWKKGDKENILLDIQNHAGSFAFSYELSDKVTILSGLGIHRIIFHQLHYTGAQFACDFVEVDVDILNSYFEQNFETYYLDIPVQFRFNNPNNNFYLQLGFDFLAKLESDGNLLLHACGESPSIITGQEVFAGLKLKDWIPLINLGFGYQFETKSGFKFYLNPLVQLSPAEIMGVNFSPTRSEDFTSTGRLVTLGLQAGFLLSK